MAYPEPLFQDAWGGFRERIGIGFGSAASRWASPTGYGNGTTPRAGWISGYRCPSSGHAGTDEQCQTRRRRAVFPIPAAREFDANRQSGPVSVDESSSRPLLHHGGRFRRADVLSRNGQHGNGDTHHVESGFDGVSESGFQTVE